MGIGSAGKPSTALSITMNKEMQLQTAEEDCGWCRQMPGFRKGHRIMAIRQQQLTLPAANPAQMREKVMPHPSDHAVHPDDGLLARDIDRQGSAETRQSTGCRSPELP